MTKLCELSAKKAREITNGAPLRKLQAAKENICNDIYCAAYQGENHYFLDFCYYEVSCPEDWCNIFNWLKDLGYTVEDNSAKKITPNFTIYW